MSHMYIESNNNKAYSLEYMACADEDKALKNPKHFFKYFDYVEFVTTSQGSMDGQNSGEKLVKNYTPTTWICNGCNIPSHSHIIIIIFFHKHSHIIYYFNFLTFYFLIFIFFSLSFFIFFFLKI